MTPRLAIAAALLGLALLLGAWAPALADRPTWGELLAQRGMIVLPLDAWREKRLSDAQRRGLPASLLARPAWPLGKVYALDGKTKFFVFAAPPRAKLVVFTARKNGRLIAGPVIAAAVPTAGQPRPVAWALLFWSDPGLVARSAGMLGGPRRPLSRAELRKSPGLGHRRVEARAGGQVWVKEFLITVRR